MRWLLALSCVLVAMVQSQRAEAACEISDFGPTAALPTQRVGQSFGFVATTDCRGLTFLATSVRLSKTPTPGVMLGADRQRYHVELSEAEWRQVSQPRVEQFNWVVYERGIGNQPLVSNEIDSDHDGWTRTRRRSRGVRFRPRAEPWTTDVVGNGVDDDCDGGIDNPRFDDPVAEITSNLLWPQLGDSPLGVGDFDADGIADLAMGNAVGNEYRGIVYVVYGPMSGSIVADRSTVLTTRSEYIGQGIGAGDADADGIADLATGSELGDAAYLLLGPVTTDRGIATAEAVFEGPAGSRAGADVDIVSDFDGDGTGDVVIGAPSSGADGEGAVYVGSGGSSGTVALDTSATYTFVGFGSQHRARSVRLRDRRRHRRRNCRPRAHRVRRQYHLPRGRRCTRRHLRRRVRCVGRSHGTGGGDRIGARQR